VTTVEVVVPTYQNVAELSRCLRSLEAQSLLPKRALVCVDGSTDGTTSFLANAEFSFEVVTLAHADGRNHGRAAARNLALTQLSSEIVVFLDSDMELEPDALRQHLKFVEERTLASVGDVVYINAQDNIWARYLATRGKNKSRPGAVIRPLDFATANTAIRSRDFTAVGGFDDTLSAGYGGEDFELGIRLAERRGVRFGFNAAARATTEDLLTVASCTLQVPLHIGSIGSSRTDSVTACSAP
jgi:GT2 family glycosyltransferase